MTNKAFETEQEAFWSGSFGDDYIDRNISPELLAANLVYFTSALARCGRLRTIFEVGANVGMNLRALGQLYPGCSMSAIEINTAAAKQLETVIPPQQVTRGSILDFDTTDQFDLVFTKGVLIHLSPDHLPEVYDKMAAMSSRYVLIGEYYNPSPVAISYRGHTDRLFKRDFCGEFMDRHPGFSLIDYGFAYHRDPCHQQDDITWFLLERQD